MTKKKKKFAPLTLTEQEGLLGGLYLAAEMTLVPSLITILGHQFGGFSEGTANYLFYWINAVCCGFVFRQLLLESLVRAGQRFGRFLLTVLAGFLILLSANQLMTGLAQMLIPDFINANNASVAQLVRENPVSMTLGLVLLVPLAEECLFRGLLFVGLADKSRYGAYALSVLAFCAIHVVGYLGTVEPLTLVICFVQYIPSGLVLAWSCEQSGSMIAPILIHAAINAGSILTL